jgi:DNA topoisomerase I
VAKSLVIVESPAKAKTINRYLGPDFIVKASMGHVCDLPKSKLGVDIEDGFKPSYQVIPEKKKNVTEIQKSAKTSQTVILAADPDREGEAISWHLSRLIEENNPRIYRAIFHEITDDGIRRAFDNLGQLNMNKVQAQQTRRILDRLVGYLISPLLWRKIGKGLSAGRVQSVALRLICEREQEIRDFKPEEYWSITALLEASEAPLFKAGLVTIDGKKARIRNADEAGAAVEVCRTAPFVLDKIKIQEKKKKPSPPHITSSLQQEAFRALRFPVKKTMFIAQKLYEGLPLGDPQGPTSLITYMRTDSFRVSDDAREAARAFIAAAFSPAHVPAKPPVYKNRKKAQDAHEAIRPVHFDLTPEKVKPHLKKEEYDVYRLIWNRFIASQMSPAVVEETEFTISVGRYGFKAKGEVVRFSGFLALAPDGNVRKPKDKSEDSEDVESGDAPNVPEGALPRAAEGETLRLADLESKQNFTQPPPRFSEGSLVRELEARGIGRPSTYAPIISTLQDRTYVIKEKGRFIPTDLGMFVVEFLIRHFADLMEIEFTARMEEELDRIGDGEADGLESLKKYHSLLDGYLKQTDVVEGVQKTGIPTEGVCPQCGKNLVIKSGRFGRFKSCSGYPDCRFRESLAKKETKMLEDACPECQAPLALKTGRYGAFVACSSYPKCKYIRKENKDTGIACPLGCGGTVLRRKTRRGKIFFGCGNYPKCTFASWDEIVNRSCPLCEEKVLYKKNVIRGEPYVYCRNEKCTFKETAPREKIWDKPDGHEGQDL